MKSFILVAIILVCLGFVGFVGMTACVAMLDEAVPKPRSTEGVVDSLFDSRTLKVGSEIAPGEYKLTPTDSIGGYVARLSCTTGNLDCIISNDLIDGPMYITVLPTDYAVQLDRVDYERVG